MTPEEMLRNTTNYLKAMKEAKRSHVAVGLPLDKVGMKIYGGNMTIFQIGAVHEYGASIDHPGGTKYTIGKDGKAKFVPNSYNGPVAGVTKPHKIEVPQRSFLRVPFAIKKAEIADAMLNYFKAISEGRMTIDVALGRIGAMATNISKGAFTTRGYGTWPDIKASTKKAKGSSQVMIDTGTTRNSITYAVRKN